MPDIKFSEATDADPPELTDIIGMERPGTPATAVRTTLAEVLALATGSDLPAAPGSDGTYSLIVSDTGATVEWDTVEGGGSDSLSGLDDVDIDSVANLEILSYDAGGDPAGRWRNVELTLGRVQDVDVVGATAGQVLAVNGAEDGYEFVSPNQAAGVVTESTTARTLGLSDAGKIIHCTNGSASTVTIPADATTDFPVGTLIHVTWRGNGAVVIEAASGVDLNDTTAGSCTLNGKYDGVAIYKEAADSWIVQGAHGGVSA